MADPNADPTRLAEHQFKPGQSGNPGGKTSAQRRLEVENAEKATRIHAALLDQVMALIESGANVELDGNVLKLAKDAQDRGLGAPKQTLEADVGFKRITRRILKPE